MTIYQMNTPKTYKELKTLPYDIQEEYLAGLVKEYGVNMTHLSEMLGISASALRSYIHHHGFHIGSCRHKLTPGEKERWMVFLTSSSIAETRKTLAQHNEEERNHRIQEALLKAEEPEKELMPSKFYMTMEFEPGFNLFDIFNKLVSLFGENLEGYKMRINFEKEDVE